MSNLIGKDVDKARASLDKDVVVRVVDVSDDGGKATGDINKDRVNLVVDNGVVVASYKG